MRIALDATYSVDLRPSGIGIYSRELLDGLASAHAADEFLHCYRIKQLRHATGHSLPNVRRRILLPPLTTFRAQVFHGLNQRVDRRPAERVVTTFHDLFVMTGEYSSPEFRARFSEQARQAAANSDMIIAVSEFTARQVHQLLGFDRAKIRVVPHGVRAAATRPPLAREKLVLSVGVLQTRKNIARLVEAFEALPEEWRLVLAGAPTGYGAEKILGQIAASRSRARIDVAGYIPAEQLERLYAQASIFAFPSLDEGFGMPVLDAMARGVPVITSNTSAMVEVAEGAAILVDPYRAEEIAEALCQLARNEEERQQLARVGRLRASRYSWQRAVTETYAVYQKLSC